MSEGSILRRSFTISYIRWQAATVLQEFYDVGPRIFGIEESEVDIAAINLCREAIYIKEVDFPSDLLTVLDIPISTQRLTLSTF